MTIQKSGDLVEVVVKVGGGLLDLPGAFDVVAEMLSAATWPASALVVPGGGPFADTVRHVGRRTMLDDDAAHWMAILAMDQYAHLIASRVRRAALVEHQEAIRAALAERRLPVLAPFRWLRTADPLPHSWDVSSDSIAAWLAGVLGARQLVLIKPSDMSVDDAVDSHFRRTLPHGVSVAILAARDVGRLESVIAGHRQESR